MNTPDAVTHRAILAIAVPMSLGYLTTPLVGLADTAFVGQLGDASAIGGVAIAAVLISLLLTSVNFLRSATSALTAQAFGRSDDEEQVAVLLRSLVIALFFGLLIIMLQVPFLWLGLTVMNPSAGVSDAARTYFSVRVWASPFTLINYVLLAWLLGRDKPLLSFALQSFLNLSNIALTAYLVLHQEMGVAGAAFGTVIAECVTAVLGLSLVARQVMAYRANAMQLAFDHVALMTMMVVNRDIMVRSFALIFAFGFFTRQSAQVDDITLAANEILLHFFMIAGYFLDGFASAVEQFVGRAIGARRHALFKQAFKRTTLWNVAQALVLSVLFFVIGTLLIDLMTTHDAVRAVARTYLPWAALTPLVGVMAFQLDGVYIGATWTRDMRRMMLLSLALYLIAYYALVPFMGNHGLWLALWLFLGARAVTLGWQMRGRVAEVFG